MRRRIVLWGLLSLGFFTLFRTPARAVDIAVYNRQLETLSSGVDNCIWQERLHYSSDNQAIAKLAESAPPVVYVSQREGRAVRVDLHWLSSGLRNAAGIRGPARVARLRSLLTRLHAQQEAARSVPDILPASAEKSRAALTKVLSRREYRPSRPEEFWQRIAGFIGNLLSRVNVPSGVADVIMWILLGIIVVLFIALLAWLVWRLVKWASLTNVEHAPRGHRAEAPISILSQSSVFESAERDAAAGRYREAFRGLYLAAILALDRANLVKYADGVTNREYLKALTGKGVEEAVTSFKPMTESFDQLIYGKRPISEREYAECRKRYDALERVI